SSRMSSTACLTTETDGPLLASAGGVRDRELPVAAGRTPRASRARGTATGAAARQRCPRRGASAATRRAVLIAGARGPVWAGDGLVLAAGDAGGPRGSVGVGGGTGGRRRVRQVPEGGRRLCRRAPRGQDLSARGRRRRWARPPAGSQLVVVADPTDDD